MIKAYVREKNTLRL